jgi:hypothetical protein
MSTATTWPRRGRWGRAAACVLGLGAGPAHGHVVVQRRGVAAAQVEQALVDMHAPVDLEAVASQAQVEHAAGDQLPVDPAQHAKSLGLEPQGRARLVVQPRVAADTQHAVTPAQA